MSWWIQYPELTFDEDRHQYKWRGSPVIGSTSLLSQIAIMKNGNWKPLGYSQFAHNQTSSDFGNAFHKICQIDLLGGTPEYPDAMQPWVDQFRKFKDEFRIIPLSDKNNNKIIEYPMYSMKYKFAGMCDFFGYVYWRKKNYIALIDWKSSTSAQEHWRWQLASYAQLCKELFGIKEKIIRIPVRFDENKYDYEIRDNHPEDWIGFQSVLNVYNMAA